MLTRIPSLMEPPLPKSLRIDFLFAALLSFPFTACSVFEKPEVSQGGGDGGGDDSGSEADGSKEDVDCPGAIKINEVDGAITGSGPDRKFIEIYNASNQPQLIAGLYITHEQGGPNVDEARQIPDDGKMLDPRAFLYLVADVPGATPGYKNAGCIDGKPLPCLQAQWTIRATGETLYLLNRDKSTILCQLRYPGTVFPMNAWGRLPDGSLNFGQTIPSPGLSNNPAP